VLFTGEDFFFIVSTLPCGSWARFLIDFLTTEVAGSEEKSDERPIKVSGQEIAAKQGRNSVRSDVSRG